MSDVTAQTHTSREPSYHSIHTEFINLIHKCVCNVYVMRMLISIINYVWDMPKHNEFCLDADTFIILCF